MDLADEESEEVQTRHNLGGISPVSTDQVLLLFTQVWSSLGNSHYHYLGGPSVV